MTAILAVFMNGNAMGATLTWDTATGDGGTKTDGSGTWTTANAWNNGVTNVTWNSGTPDTAIIGSGGTAGTITVSSTIEVAGITFNATSSGTYTVSGTADIRIQDAANTVFLANQAVNISAEVTTASPDTGSLVLDAAAGVTATLSGNYATANNGHTDTLTKQGLGTWEMLGATNDTKGAITVTAGTLKLGGAATFTRATTIEVSGGTFLLASTAADRINNTANVTLSGGTIQLGTSGMNETVGTLTLSATSTIDFGSLAGGATFRFTDSSAATWGSFDLNIYNWTDGLDHLFFGSVFQGGLPVGGLGKIKFYSDNGATSLGSAGFLPLGEVAPAVPEPSAVLMGLGLLSLAGYRERRWILRCRDARRTRIA